MTEPVHTYGCAFKQRGAECDCGDYMRPLWEAALGKDAMGRLDRAMSRGFDYSALVDGLAEGFYEGES